MLIFKSTESWKNPAHEHLLILWRKFKDARISKCGTQSGTKQQFWWQPKWHNCCLIVCVWNEDQRVWHLNNCATAIHLFKGTHPQPMCEQVICVKDDKYNVYWDRGEAGEVERRWADCVVVSLGMNCTQFKEQNWHYALFIMDTM